MTGLDKMISQIIEEAEQSAKGMLDEANAKAEETAKAAAEDAGKLKEQMWPTIWRGLSPRQICREGRQS